MARVPNGAGRRHHRLRFPAHIDLVGLRRVHALVFVEHGTRGLHIAGVNAHPTAQWTVQQAGTLAVNWGVRLESLPFIVRDRDGTQSSSPRSSRS